jgi:glycosyltransferase involved in cell wall biosynthesis
VISTINIYKYLATYIQLSQASPLWSTEDPRLKGCPLIGCSSGFGSLCGYTMDDIVGRQGNLWGYDIIGIHDIMGLWFGVFDGIYQYNSIYIYTHIYIYVYIYIDMYIYIWLYIYIHICVMNMNSEQTVLGFLDFVVFYGVNSQRLQLVPWLQELSISGRSRASREDRSQNAKACQGPGQNVW